MIFSYYFDEDKTHLINFGIVVRSINERANKDVEVSLSCFIEEKNNDEIVKREVFNRLFTFPFNPMDPTNHDIDFLRKRFTDDNKWILEVRNNKNSSQNILIGLISETATRNPLGLNIIYDETNSDMELRANNLSIIDQSERSPVVKQTMVQSDFSSLGYPRGFSSTTANQDRGNEIILANEFKQEYLEGIPENSFFAIELNIAPKSLDLKDQNNPFYEFSFELGIIKAYRNRLVYIKEGQTEGEAEFILFDGEKNINDFYNAETNSFQVDSLFNIEGDGRGFLTIRYGSKTIQTSYNPETELKSFNFKGGITNRAIEPAQEVLPQNWETHMIDNIHVFYNK